MNKLLLKATSVILLVLVGGAINSKLMGQADLINPILVSNNGVSVESKEAMVPLADLLTSLEQHFEVTFLFKDKVVRRKQVNIDRIQLGQDTGIQLAGMLTRLGLSYYRVDEQTYVLLPQTTLLTKDTAQETISGIVTDASSGEPIPGVNILVKGTSTGASTNANGEYELTVESLQDTLIVSFIGYEKQEVPINGRSTVDIAMHTQTISGEEMVVIGFGQQSRRNIVGSVSSVDMESLDKTETSTVAEKLHGKISGVNVTRATGALGSSMKINIRGTSSINASSQPLYVIDGIPVVDENVGGGQGFSSLVNLDPNNIESMEILKDASASAIYGTRGSNGVVLITTKSGVSGDPQLAINVSGGISKVTNKMDLLNSSEYLDIYNYKNGTNYNPSDFAKTDWQDEVSKIGSYQKYNVSLSGGSTKSTYHISGNYKDQIGSLVGNSLKMFSANAKLNYDFNDRLNIGLSVQPSVTNISSLGDYTTTSAGFGMAVLYPPVVPIFAPDGSVNDGINRSVFANQEGFSPFAGTPYANVRFGDRDNNSKQVLASIDVSYDILSNLSLKSQFGYRFFDVLVNSRYKNNTSTGYPNGSVSGFTQSFANANWNNTLTYNNDWGLNSLELTFGTTLEQTTKKNFSASKSNIPGFSLKTLDSGAEAGSISGDNTSFSYQNNVIRAFYSYDDKYLITLTGSYNGTSRFAENHRYGFFPAIAAGWIVSDEGFLENLNFLSFLKLRMSYGMTGNANIGNFEYPSLLNAGVKYNEEPGLNFSQLANLGLTWEKSRGFNVALEYGFLNDRLTGTIGYYNKITTDLLLARRVSNINGFTSVLRNGGEMLNSGVEFNFDADVISNNNLQWNISGNIATLHNKIKDLPGGPIIPDEGSYGSSNIVTEGEPISAFYMPVYKGVDPQNGDALYGDGEGGATSNYSSAPRQIVGYPHPKFYGGFGTNLSFKGLDFSVQFSYSYGNKVYWSRGEYLLGGASVYNQVSSVTDYWTPENTEAVNPEPRLTSNGNNISTRFLADGTYLRLNSLQLGYTINPNNFIGAKSIRLYIGGENLITFTSFPGFDPEVTASPTSNISQGVSRGNAPPSMMINGGIQIKM